MTSACALGVGTRPQRRVQSPSRPLHRPRCRSGADSTLVRVMRWQLEVTSQEESRYQGFMTQRQWRGFAIRRTTPALLGLFSVVTLFAHGRMMRAAGALRQAAWYHKRGPTFADALVLVRKELWVSATFYGSPERSEMVKVPRAFMERLTDAVCYAA
jgi:hypothetical protein